MTVFIVKYSGDHENEPIYGVFSTREKATMCANYHLSENTETTIEEWETDGAKAISKEYFKNPRREPADWSR